jgi:benzoate-CoA ligase family protein
MSGADVAATAGSSWVRCGRPAPKSPRVHALSPGSGGDGRTAFPVTYEAMPTNVPERFNAAAFFVDRHLEEGRGGRIAFRYLGQTITYADVADRANRFGKALLGLGVDIENRVVLALSDTPEFATAFWGAIKIGAVAVPVSTTLGAAEYEFLLNDSRARAVVADEALAPVLTSIRAGCPFLKHLIVAEPARAGTLVAGGPRPADALAAASPPAAATRTATDILSLDAVVDGASAHLEPAPTQKDDVAYWGYTSGSTGRPKAALHAHQDFVHAAELVGMQVFGLGPEDLVFSASKLYFAFGLGNSLYFPARVAAASVLYPNRLDAERAFEVIARERPTVFLAVPTLYARMLHAVDDAGARHDLSSLRLCVSSGEALPPAIFHAWKARFGHELIDVVGSTEALHDFIATRPGRARPGAAGQVIPGFEARLVDDLGNPVIPGSVGHLLIKGETTALSYWNRREQTRRTMLGEWLRTGDMFYEDSDRYFHFCGRSDDMLKVGAMWVSPVEIEARLTDHPAVLEAGVIGRPDGDGLVKPHAFVVLNMGVSPSKALDAELREFVRARLGGYKSPGSIEFVSDLPKTSTGKIQRFLLRARS